MTTLTESHIPSRAENSPLTEHKAPSTIWSKLPGLLRGAGCIAILLSLYSVMMEGWQNSGDFSRYLILLAHTLALPLLAFANAGIMKEGKSARLLLMLTLGFIVADCAIAGAFIFAEFNALSGYHYPSYFRWALDSGWQLLVTLLLLAVIAIPASYLAFKALVRSLSKRLFAFFIIANACLLLPLREPWLVVTLVAVMGTLIFRFSVSSMRQRCELQTLEGSFALLVQFLPLGVLLIRNIWLYDASMVLFDALAIMVFVGVRQLWMLLELNGFWRIVMQMVSVAAALVIGITSISLLNSWILDEALLILLGNLLVATCLYEVSLRPGAAVNVLRVIASLLVAIGVVINLFVADGWWSSIIMELAGAALVVVSVKQQQRSLLTNGLLLLIAGFGYQCLHIVVLFDYNYWFVLALAGALALVAASMLESRANRVKQWLQRYQGRLKHWAY